ncbi:MAG: bifunctional ADP-dependent NAD(P)H-hydrate dehydratase/NAD(P)H-hydrate epimerase [Candidatus Solibacter sp.]|nr:bifunctional ADP-dependent NAD(P)H-hydrate dehydratase/NAD(P)H-hydrate epimerase [Candidatus Solibacter sp.]
MKVLTADQLRELDRRTIESGVPELVLMENAGCRVAEFLASRFAPLDRQRIVILCGKGNNGGDGLVVARQLHMLHRTASLDVVLPWDEAELSPCAAANLRMLKARGVEIHTAIRPHMRAATLVLDAVLGTGLRGPASGAPLDLIREINTGFPGAVAVAVDMPSGLGGGGEHTMPAATVTFTAPKLEQVMPPTCDATGELVVRQIGTPPRWMEADDGLRTVLVEPRMFAGLFGPRPRGAHKGDFGHVLVVGGAPGKGGAAAMAGLAALCAGAGLVTVAAHESERPAVTALAPELMTGQVPDDPRGKDVAALGPGLGVTEDGVALARRAFAEWRVPMVVDADGLNALAGTAFKSPGAPRILTPHPGEMARLAGTTTAEVQAGRAGAARKLAAGSGCIVVLKGQKTLTALPCGRLYINPTGTPAMATAGSGDILTGLIAGLLAQHPDGAEMAVVAAVWLHGRAGELAAASLTENCVTATCLLDFLPEAIRETRQL